MGDDNCDRYDSCKVVEKPGGKCQTSEECRGKRSCTIAQVCVGETFCEDDIRLEKYPCEITEKEFGKCENNKQCQGARKCVKGYCSGESECVKEDKKCLINEDYNPLGSGRCQKDDECKGARTCSSYFKCIGTSGCKEKPK